MCETEAVPWMTQGTAQQHLEMMVTITGMTLNTVEVHSQLNLVAVLALCNKGSICNLKLNLKEEGREDFLIIHTEDLKQYLIF